MNTEKHYADGGEPHYKRVTRLGLSWCRANITKYAERTKNTPTDDLIKIADYALMELEQTAFIATDVQIVKLNSVRERASALYRSWLGAKGQPETYAAGYGAVCAEDRAEIIKPAGEQARNQFIARPGRD